MASPDSIQQDQIGGFLHSLLKGYIDITGAGKIFGSRFAFKLSEYNAPEPDLAFVSKERLHLVHETGMTGAPDIAVEIVSKESKKRDYYTKRGLYETAGVLEYWIIDPLQKTALFYRLDRGTYKGVRLKKGSIFCSRVLKGFELDVRWLWQDPLPKIGETMVQIVGEVKVMEAMGLDIATFGKKELIEAMVKEGLKEELRRMLEEL